MSHTPKPSTFSLPEDFETVPATSIGPQRNQAPQNPQKSRDTVSPATNTTEDIENAKKAILRGTAEGTFNANTEAKHEEKLTPQRDTTSKNVPQQQQKPYPAAQKSVSAPQQKSAPPSQDELQFKTHLKTLQHLLKTDSIEKMVWNASKENVYNEATVAKYFEKKVVLITGASKGLGRHIAVLLSKYHTRLVLCARGMEELYEVRKECLKAGADEVLVVGCDVTIEVQCKRVVDAAINRFGRIDVLLLNVGVSGNQLFTDMKDLSVFHRMFKTNTMGYVNFVHHALPHLRRQDEARIAVISSMSGKIGVPYRSAYCTSKYAVQGFFEVLRNELKADPKSNVSVTVCSPGWIQTNIAENYLVNDERSQRNHYKLTVDECARGVLYAIATKVREERFQQLYRMLPFIGSVCPDYVDQVALKAVGLSAKM